MPETGAPMCGHDDQIYPLGGRALRNPLVWNAGHDAARGPHLCTRDPGEEMIQLSFGLLLNGLEQEGTLMCRGVAVDQV
jgi:hypothetical protein